MRYVICARTTGLRGRGPARCVWSRDTVSSVSAGRVFVRGKGSYMWYSLRTVCGYDLGYATSADGIVWRRNDRAAGLERGPVGSWDAEMVGLACLLETSALDVLQRQRLRRDRDWRRGGGGYLSTGLTVEPYAPAQRDEWDDLVSSARARHFFFQRGYMDYHADRFIDSSFIVRLGGQAIAAFPAGPRNERWYSWRAYVRRSLSTPELTTARAVAALDAVAALLKSGGARRLVYKPVPHIYHVAPAEEDLYALHAAGAVLVRREVSAAVCPAVLPAIRPNAGEHLRVRAERGSWSARMSGSMTTCFFSATSYATGTASSRAHPSRDAPASQSLPEQRPDLHRQARRRATGRRTRLRDGASGTRAVHRRRCSRA